MLDFVVSNYIIFIIIAVVLLLGLFGYMMDRKKYEDYRDEIINEAKAVDTLQAAPDVVNNVIAPISMNENVPTVDASATTEAPAVVDVPVTTVQTVTPVAIQSDNNNVN